MTDIPRYVTFVVWYICVIVQVFLFSHADKPSECYEKLDVYEVSINDLTDLFDHVLIDLVNLNDLTALANLVHLVDLVEVDIVIVVVLQPSQIKFIFRTLPRKPCPLS